MDLMEEISPILMTAEPTPTDERSEECAIQRMLSTRSTIGETQSSWPKERQNPSGAVSCNLTQYKIHPDWTGADGRRAEDTPPPVCDGRSRPRCVSKCSSVYPTTRAKKLPIEIFVKDTSHHVCKGDLFVECLYKNRIIHRSLSTHGDMRNMMIQFSTVG